MKCIYAVYLSTLLISAVTAGFNSGPGFLIISQLLKTDKTKAGKKHEGKVKIKVAKTAGEKAALEKKLQAELESAPDTGGLSKSRDMQWQLFSSLLYMGATMYLKRVDFTNKNILRLSRVFFVAYMILSQLLFFFLRQKVESLDDETKLVISNPLAALAGATSKLSGPLGTIAGMAGLGGNQEAVNAISVKDYDLGIALASMRLNIGPLTHELFSYHFTDVHFPTFYLSLFTLCRRDQ